MSQEPKPPRRPRDSQPPDLNREREQLLSTFARGAKLSEQLLEETAELRQRLQELEQENERLRLVVEANVAIRELLQTIEKLEGEKQELLNRFERAEAKTTSMRDRFDQVESEFANLANLFVAVSQLHGSVSPRGVMRRIKEVLAQLVGAERYGLYLLDAEGSTLVPIGSEGLLGDELRPLPVVGPLATTVDIGAASWSDGDTSAGTVDAPAAVVPLMLEQRVIGVMLVAATLGHKQSFEDNDLALLRLLGQHAGGALVAASLHARADGQLPGLEAFTDLSV